MQNDEKRVIKLSKGKIVRLLAIACGFVALGIWMWLMNAQEIEAERRFNDSVLVHGLGLVSIVFFGFCGLYAVRKLFDDKPGLVLSAAGLDDNSSAIAVGLIPWAEISGFSIFQIARQNLLVVELKNPAKYANAGNPLRRLLNQINFKMAGSSISISSNTLQIEFDELVRLCREYQMKFGTTRF